MRPAVIFLEVSRTVQNAKRLSIYSRILHEEHASLSVSIKLYVAGNQRVKTRVHHMAGLLR